MTQYGFIRIAAAIPEVKVADPEFNAEAIISVIKKAAAEQAEILVVPELSTTAYTCGDLFSQQPLLDASNEALIKIAGATAESSMLVAVGAPIASGRGLLNCAVMIAGGEIICCIPKTFIPNYAEFYEKRWFQPGPEELIYVKIGEKTCPCSSKILVDHSGALIGAEICEDLWVPEPPSGKATKNGASIVLNLSASDEVSGKHTYLRNLISQQSARCRCAYAYASAGFGESTTDLVFAGNAIIAEDGTMLAEAPRFSATEQIVYADVDVSRLIADRRKYSSFFDSYPDKFTIVSSGVKPEKNDNPDLRRSVNPRPFVPDDPAHLDERCAEIVNIQSEGLMKRLHATGCRSAVIGISGGLDSTLALLVTARAFDRLKLDRKGITGITMPGFGTTGRTHNNAVIIMEQLGVSIKEIPIAAAVNQHFSDIDHDPMLKDVTYENSQARERTQILMDFANKTGGMVIGTGDLSELALGWATYNGDHMSMYSVNAGVPKTLVRYLVAWFADSTENEILRNALFDIIDTPVSPELIPADGEVIVQKTEDLVGPYELHDFFLYQMLRYGFGPKKIYYLARKAFAGSYSDETIQKWLKTFVRRFFAQQFKRSCLPDGPKVGSVCLSPRGDWRMPSDASAALWRKEADTL